MGSDGEFNTMEDRGEFQLKKNYSQTTPVTNGNIIVWTDDRNKNDKDNKGLNIYGAEAGSDGKFGTPYDVKFNITNDDHPKSNPAIFQNIVVWTENKYKNNDIYGAYLNFEKLFPTPTPTASPQTVQPIITLPPTTATITI